MTSRKIEAARNRRAFFGYDPDARAGVYGLADPRTGKIRYVGRAVDIDRRYKHHCSHRHDPNLGKRAWVAELRAAGLKPQLAILCRVYDASMRELKQVEVAEISKLRSIGEADLNLELPKGAKKWR